MGADSVLPLAMAGSALLALANGGIWFWDWWSDQSSKELDERFERLVRGESVPVRQTRRNFRGFLTDFGQRRLRTGAPDPEIRVLLAQAGYPGREPLALFTALRLVFPVAMTLVALGLYLSLGASTGLGFLGTGYAVFAMAFLLPKKILQTRATGRVNRIREEVTVLTHMLRVLYDCGLSTEQALTVFGREQAHVLPDLSVEVGEVIRLVSAGSDLATGTREVSEKLDLPEMTDLFALLRQIDQYGGSVQEPLLGFADLLEDRERTRLQESISQLSAKLTAVMVLFLLPALLTFVAGPGFISVIRALSDMNR